MENLNLVELKQDELQEVEGGFLGTVGLFLLAGFIYDTVSNLDASAAAFDAGYAAGRN